MSIFEYIKNNKNKDPVKILNDLLENNIYTIEEINFAFYDLFNIDIDDVNELLEERIKRVKQTEFRNELINRDKNCIISGEPSDICEAAHIIPYNECKNFDVNNGLLLNASLHKLFDKYKFSINPKTLEITFDKSLLNNNSYINYTKYHGVKLNLTKKIIKNLEYHWNNFIK
jgi:hypothetical protein